MSVLVKGMEMPRCCAECGIDVDSCKLWEEFIKRREERHPDCPLVEVPTPHGRLIDADALCDSGEPDLCQEYVCDGYAEDSEWGFSREAIKRFPVIIEAEV